jgi:hypothetical protein
MRRQRQRDQPRWSRDPLIRPIDRVLVRDIPATLDDAGKLIEKLVGGSVTDYRHHLFADNELVAA